MGSCIICGVSVDGRICDSHQEDVVFEFRGESPDQLVSGRYYRGTVDGYADFGVFVDLAPGVTGLLHRSELDRRLESLDWEPGDTVFVQVKNVRDNGNIDLGWSIRQDEREFRGALIQEGDTDREPETADDEGNETEAIDENETEATDEKKAAAEDVKEADAAGEGAPEPETGDESVESPEERSGGRSAETDGTGDGTAPEPSEATGDASATAVAKPTSEAESGAEPEPSIDRATVEDLSDAVGETVRLEGEIVSVRQTGGPTVFELRDETGVVDCAAFVEPGVRAYPDVGVDDVVRLEGDVELRRNEIQVETEALVALDGDDRTEVVQRLEDALAAKARPDSFEPIGDHETVEALREPILDAAEALRRAVLESRPIVVRHPATANGYLAGAAVERAVLPLVAEEYAGSDAEYHYFKRRPLESSVYDMDDATMDVTRMLQDRDRHDEKLPVFLLLGTGATAESEDGLDLLDIYDATRIVVDAEPADPEAGDHAAVLVAPDEDDEDDLSVGALGAELAAAIDADARDGLVHLPATSYWESSPETYAWVADEAGYDADRRRDLREAVALEAYYQSYEDKRELLTDLLFGDGGADLAAHVAEQFRVKVDTEVATARENIERTARDGVELALLDADAYTHRYDFPPTSLLLDELHRRERTDGAFATVGVGTDELFVRATFDLDLRAVVDDAREAVPEADLGVADLRDGRVEFLAGRRNDARDAIVEAVVDRA